MDATTLHDFSTAPVVHPVGSSAPALKRQKTEEDALLANTAAGLVTLPIAASTLKNTSIEVDQPHGIPMLPENGYFEYVCECLFFCSFFRSSFRGIGNYLCRNLPSDAGKLGSPDKTEPLTTAMNGKSRKRKMSICGVQLKYRGRRRKINVFNLFQSLQSKALKEKDPSFKRTDLTPKQRVLQDIITGIA